MKKTIQEVYDQLSKEELGTERAKIFVDDEEFKIIGPDGDGGFVVFGFDFEFYKASARVEWIGNKPKKEKRHAYLDKKTWSLRFARKERMASDTNWLPEDQYPPIEVEVGE